MHEIANFLGQEKAYAQPVFHAFTGFDTGIDRWLREKRAWDTWMAMNCVTRAFTVMRDQASTLNVGTTITLLIVRTIRYSDEQIYQRRKM